MIGQIMAGPNGGARPGAGRKPKAQVFENEITKADKRIAKNLIRYIENMERLADGVTVESYSFALDKDVVYKEPPNRQANEYLINRIMGKPTERQEHSGPEGSPIALRRAEDLTDDDLAAIVASGGGGTHRPPHSEDET